MDQNTPATLWLLGDGKAGHENQSLGIADHLGAAPALFRLPYGKQTGFYRELAWAFAALLPVAGPWLARHRLARLALLMTPPLPLQQPPRLVMATGTLCLPVLVMLRRGLGLNTVAIMSRRPFPAAAFSAMVVHRHGSFSPHRRDFKNRFIEVLGAPNRLGRAGEPPPFTEEISQATTGQSSPLAVILGGPPDWAEKDEAAFLKLVQHLGQSPHPLLLTTSRRTPAAVDTAVAALPKSRAPFVLIASQQPGNPIPAMVQTAAVCVVTADSISMVSECLSAHKPVVAVQVWGTDPTGRGAKFAGFLSHLAQEGHLLLAQPETVNQTVEQALTHPFKPFPLAAEKAALEIKQLGLWP